jgi:hypothetical protein
VWSINGKGLRTNDTIRTYVEESYITILKGEKKIMYDDLLGPRKDKEKEEEEIELAPKEIEVGIDKSGNITRQPVQKNVLGGSQPTAKPDSDSDEDVWDDVEDLLLEDCDGDCDNCEVDDEGVDDEGDDDAKCDPA